MRTLIAIPCMDQVAAPFAQSLATLNKVGETAISMIVGSLIYDSRNKLATFAVKNEMDYILWLDSDMTFPPDMIERMLKHLESGKDIVTGVYYRRQKPYSPVLFSEIKCDGDNSSWKDYNNYPSDGLFEVAGCGFGCVMMKVEVLIDMMADLGDWFSPIGHFGEDLSFCIRANQLGYKVWCDPSIQCGHVGHMIVNEDFYKAFNGGGNNEG